MISMNNTFSNWMRSNLKDAYSGLITQDIDFVYFNEERNCLFFIEEKNSSKARIGPAQKIIFKLFDDFFNKYPSFKGTIILQITNDISVKQLEELIKEKLKYRQKFEIEDNILKNLWDCKKDPKINKTEQERSGYRGSRILKALNNNHPPDWASYLFKIDWVFVNYCSGNFIFIEEVNDNKSFIEDKYNKFITKIDKIFNDIQNSGHNAENPKSRTKYKYLGYYILNFINGTHPDNCSKILLNNKEITKDRLKELLNLDNEDIKCYRTL